MPLYICKTPCIWKQKGWFKGETVEVKPPEKPPHHFEILKAVKKATGAQLQDPRFLKIQLTALGVPFSGRWKLRKLRETYIQALNPERADQLVKPPPKTRNPFVTEKE